MPPKFPAKRYIPGLGRFFDIRSDEIADKTLLTADIADGAVTNVKLAGLITGDKLKNSAVGSFITPTLVLVDHADASPVDLLIADALNDRLVIVEALVTETATAIPPAIPPDIDVGSETTDTDACFDDLAAGAWAEGERYVGGCLLPAGEKLQCTINFPGSAGKILFYVVAFIPTVQTNQIANSAVTDAKLAGSITEAKLAGSIPGAKLLDNAVNYTPAAAEVEVDHAGAASVVLLAADGNVDRLVVVQAIGSEDAAGAGPRTKFDVGPTGSLTACFNDLVAGAWKAGERYLGVCIVPKTTDLLCSVVNGGGAPAGKVKFRTLVVTPLVQTNQIANTAVTAAKLATDAVETAKILDANVTAAKLANGAGIAALVTAGLGNSANALYADAPTKNVLALDAGKIRAVLVIAICTVKPAGTLNHATFAVGYPAALDAFLTVVQMDAANVGTVLVGAGLLPIGKTLDVTITNGGDVDADDAGAFAVTVLALPTS